MPILIVLWKFKYWITISVLSFICFGQIAYTNHLSGKLRKAGEQCTTKIQEIEQKHIKTLAKKQNAINQVSGEYEQTKEAERVRTEYITRDVQKIVERPIYINNCFDTDGVSAINSLIASYSSESSSTLP